MIINKDVKNTSMNKITPQQKNKLFWGIFTLFEMPWLYSLLARKGQKSL